MASRPVTQTILERRVLNAAWDTITTTNQTGDPAMVAPWGEVTVHVFGTFGGTTITIQGSNDGSNWDELHFKGTTTAMALTSTTRIGAANEVPRFVRPSESGGDGTTDVDVILVASPIGV